MAVCTMPPESWMPHSATPATVSTPDTPMAAFKAAPPQAWAFSLARSALRPAALAASRPPSLKSISSDTATSENCIFVIDRPSYTR